MNRPRPCTDPARRWRLALWLAARCWRFKPLTPAQRAFMQDVCAEHRIIHWTLLTDRVLLLNADRCFPTKRWVKLWKKSPKKRTGESPRGLVSSPHEEALKKKGLR